MAKIGRPIGARKYTAAAFRKGCEAYFASISYVMPVTRPELMLDEENRPVLDKYGHPIYRNVRVKTEDGNEAEQICWVEPPSIQSLCLFLGIDASTFSRYQKADPDDPEREKMARIAAMAKARVEAYLISRLEDKGAANGTKFNLQHNFGWMERKTDDQTMGSEPAPGEEDLRGLTMSQKLELLKEAGVDVTKWE